MTALSTHLYIEREGPCVYYQYCSMECIMILDSLHRLYHNVQSLRARGSRDFHRTFVETFRHAKKLKYLCCKMCTRNAYNFIFLSFLPPPLPPFFKFILINDERYVNDIIQFS